MQWYASGRFRKRDKSSFLITFSGRFHPSFIFSSRFHPSFIGCLNVSFRDCWTSNMIGGYCSSRNGTVLYFEKVWWWPDIPRASFSDYIPSTRTCSTFSLSSYIWALVFERQLNCQFWGLPKWLWQRQKYMFLILEMVVTAVASVLIEDIMR